MQKNSAIYLAGHRGLVGSAILRRLTNDGYTNLITRPRAELDLTNPTNVDRFFAQTRPEYVISAAAKVGGIMANRTYPGDFIRENLLIQTLVIDAVRRYEVKKLLFLGSSCIYPRLCPQPMKEEYFQTGPVEPTNAAYAIAKIAGVEMCRAYHQQYKLNSICPLPANIYGPGDNFDPQTSHVLASLIRKACEAKLQGIGEISVWGTGQARREFMFVDDLAEACLFLMREYDQPEIINVGTGVDATIRELAETVCEVVGCKARLVFDPTKPDGMPRKLLDVSRLSAMGWKPRTSLREGIAATVRWLAGARGWSSLL